MAIMITWVTKYMGPGFRIVCLVLCSVMFSFGHTPWVRSICSAIFAI